MNRVEKACVWGSATYLLVAAAFIALCAGVGCGGLDPGRDDIMGVTGSGPVDEHGRRTWTGSDVAEVEMLQQGLSNPTPIPITNGYLCNSDPTTYQGEQNWFTEFGAGDHCWGYNADAFCRFTTYVLFDGANTQVGLNSTTVSIPNLNRYNMNDRIRSVNMDLNAISPTSDGDPDGNGAPITATIFADTNNAGHSFSSQTGGGPLHYEIPDQVNTFLGVVTSRQRWVSSIRYTIGKRCQ